MFKKKKKNKKGGKKGNIFKQYTSAEIRSLDPKTKKSKLNVKNFALKSGSEIVTSAAGMGAGAGLGIYAPWVGGGLILLSNFLDDRTGLLSVFGSSMFSWGIAKAIENRNASEDETVNGLGFTDGAKRRLIDFKDNFIKAFYIDKLMKSDNSESGSDSESDQSVGAIDLSSLDVFDEMSKESAINFEVRKARQEMESDSMDLLDEDFDEESSDFLDEDELQGLNFAFVEDEIDFATI